MRFLQIADVHLGANPEVGRLQSEHRKKEIWDSFAKVIECCNTKKIDLLLIAGDLFHRQPLMRELKEVSHLFGRISDTKVVLIVGNHDYLKKDSYYYNFPWPDNVTPILSEYLTSVTFADIDTTVYGLSYTSREIKEPLLCGVKAERRSKWEILLAHGGDELHLPFHTSNMLESGFDYIALGHIHKPFEIVKNRMSYAGALEPIDKNDTGVHGYIVGEATNQGIKTCFIPAAKREYKHEEIVVKETTTERQLMELLEETIKRNGKEHFYKITVKGFRDTDIEYAVEYMEPDGNLIEIIDETVPSYDFQKLCEQNHGNLLGRFIESLQGAAPDSIEYQALYEGVEALVETKRTQQ